jgi:glycosyltransferase involved in cell wall biosynthesis
MKVTQICIGRFHHFHTARELEKRGLLEAIYTGYPRFQLKDEHGIPPEKIKTFPWFQTPYMAKAKLPFRLPERIVGDWAILAHETLDRHVSRQVKTPGVIFALSGSGLHSGRKMQKIGGKFICDRGSTHIRFQNEILHEEYQRWGIAWKGIDPRSIDKEEAEYEIADRITVPSEFVRRSFVAKGVPPERLVKVPYGARLSRFGPGAPPSTNSFVVLFVGNVSLQKGFLDLLEAFQRFKHPHKELRVIGAMSADVATLLRSRRLEKVSFLGNVSNVELPQHYREASVFVLPSIQDGFGMVMGEALACGCPVIASSNTGAEDLFTDGEEGFIVSARSVESLTDRLQLLADDATLRNQMGVNAVKRVAEIGGWNQYGDTLQKVLLDLSAD